MDPVKQLQENPFVLAPMAGITDHAFRSFMRKMNAGVVVTELISATGLEYGNKRTRDLMSFDESQRPIGIQLFGEDPDTLARAARYCQEQNCDFVDLNFGCPVPKVVKKGGGSAVLKDLGQLQKIVSTVKAAIDIPLTIKIRTGWDSNSRNATEACNIAYNEGISWVAIHGRTRAQGYSGLADWDFIADVKANTKIPILGNGDILTGEQAVLRLKQSGCDGVMIGRGALKNPYIFQEALSLWKNEPFEATHQNFEAVYDDLKNYILAHCSEQISMIQLRKYAAWFSTGYPGAAAFRKKIFQSQTMPEIMEIASDFFKEVGTLKQQDTSSEEFLMGGHG